MMLVLVSDYALSNPDDCTNSGPCCFSCPLFDQCDQHYDPEVE